MRFADLYNYVNNLDTPVISVRNLARRIEAHHPTIGKVSFYPVDIDSTVSPAHIIYEKDRTSPYEDEFKVANIRFERTLNRCWRRFVCCKELMHVFDTEAERVSSKDRFMRLMKDIDNKPMPGDQSPMFTSEMTAEWMALIALCPNRLRDAYLPQFKDKSLSEYDIALMFKIPEACVTSLMSDYYLDALARVTA